MIHARGIKVTPRTLTIGDYVLSPDIVVERKSVEDLYSWLGLDFHRVCRRSMHDSSNHVPRGRAHFSALVLPACSSLRHV